MQNDDILVEVVSAALAAVPREMAANLRRSAFSSIVREARDFAVAIVNPSGDLAFQPEDTIPMMTLGISSAFRGLGKTVDMSVVGEDDAFLVNDPFRGGQHLQDVYLFTPIFYEGELVAYGASTAHHADLGGAEPGLNPHATEIYQEGLRLPHAPFSVSRDWNGGFVEGVIAANVRVPEVVIGDINAQFAANNTARTRVGEVCDRYGVTAVSEVMKEAMDYAERRLRKNIAAIPDGTYSATQEIDGQPWGDDHCAIKVAVTVSGSDIHVDFTGSSDQVKANVNCPLASTYSAIHAALRGVLDEPDIPFNEGCNRPISATVPYGSILNPRPPAAVRARLTPASRAFDAIVRAMSTAVPKRVTAAGFDTTTSIAISYLHPETGAYDVVVEILGGGWGAGPYGDGADALDNPISNCANAPIEALENAYSHFRVVSYGLTPGSGGNGKFRGGLGFTRTYEATRDSVSFSAYADRHRSGAPGLFGGEVGGTGSFEVHRVDGTVETLPIITGVELGTGDQVVVRTGGGGGFGTPDGRELALISRDVEEQFVSASSDGAVEGGRP